MARRAWGVVSGVRYAGSPTSAVITPVPTISAVTVAIAANGDLALTIDGSQLDLATAVTFGALACTIDAQAAGQITASGRNAYTDGFRFGLSADVVVTDGSNPDTAGATVPVPVAVDAWGEITAYDALGDQTESAWWQVSADPAVADGWFGAMEDPNSVSGLVFTVADGLYSADAMGSIFVRGFNPAGAGVHGDWTARVEIQIAERFDLTVTGLRQAQTVASPSLVVTGGPLFVTALRQAQQVASVALSEAATLSPSGLLQAQAVGSVSIAYGWALSVSDLLQAQAVEAVQLQQDGVLVVTSLAQTQQVESPGIAQSIALTVTSIQQDQVIEQPQLSEAALLEIRGLLQSSEVEGVALAEAATLVVSDLLHEQLLQRVILPGTVFSAGRLMVVKGTDRMLIVTRARVH